jgi:hypothetical protein
MSKYPCGFPDFLHVRCVFTASYDLIPLHGADVLSSAFMLAKDIYACSDSLVHELIMMFHHRQWSKVYMWWHNYAKP